MTNRCIQEIGSPSISEPKLKGAINEKDLSLGLARSRFFKELLLEAIDKGLSSLGDSAKQALYFHLERTRSIQKQEIPNRIEEFTNAIEEIFGLGAKILEIQMIKCLHEKIGHDFKHFPEKDDLSFTKYVEAASLYSENCF